MKVLVIGGGAVGCSVAYFLQRAGAAVTIAERQRPGSGASSAAAGMLAPLAESPDASPFTRLAVAGLRAFQQRAEELAAESGIDFEYRREGMLRVAESPQEAEALRRAIAWQAQTGLQTQWLDAPQLRQLEPELEQGLVGALYSPGEGHVNPTRLTEALASAAVRRGARLFEGCAVEQLELGGGRVSGARCSRGRIGADAVVLASGAWVGRWQEQLQLPVFPVRGQMAALQCTPPPVRHIIYSRDGYLVPKADGSIFVGATEEDGAGYAAVVTTAGLHWLLGVAQRLVPALAGAVYLRSWAGLRPASADRLPLLGPAPGYDNLFIAGGHFRNGILLSLISGELLARRILGEQVPELEPFSPVRFGASSA